MRRHPVVFFDRDGTLIHTRPGWYLRRPEEVRLYAGAPQAMRLLRSAGYRLVIVSNQSGLARGFLDEKTLARIHSRMLRELRRQGASLDGIYFCPHHPEDRCRCRKPSPLLARRAVRDLGLTLSGSAVVGDKKADVDLGRALGVASVLVTTGEGRSQMKRWGKRLRPTHVARSLLSAAKFILSRQLLLLLLLSSAASAQLSPSLSSPYELINSTAPLTQPPQRMPWLPEALEYEVKWGIFLMGFSNLRITQVDDFAGQSAYRIVSEARTNGFADAFYKVRDLNESWLRADDLVSLGYLKQLREGKFFRDEWVLYDYPARSYLSRRTDKDASFEVSTGTLPGFVQDVLSSLYYVRSHKLAVGDEVVLDVNTRKTWPLVAKVLRKTRVEVPAGKFDVVIVDVRIREEGIFMQKGKELQVYLTDDERHLPVLMKVEIVFGHISAYLTRVKSE
ncbi:MAG: HAD-IIIA family hydrolase [Elusimicrobiota bacterium]